MKSFPSQITLIGMSGVGKSSIGKSVASQISYNFIDTDRLIETHINKSITLFIQQNSENAFLDVEEQCVLNTQFPNNSVIATGGSMIYSDIAIKKLSSSGPIILIHDTIENILRRTPSLTNRGIINPTATTIPKLYQERMPLYKKYATHKITLSYPFHLKNETKKLIDLLGTIHS